MTTNASELIITGDITETLLNKTHRLINDNTGGVYYRVESASVEFDENGDRVEYTVRYSKENGYTCTCKAGQDGFVHCGKGYCWHVRAVVKHAALYKAEMRDYQEAVEASDAYRVEVAQATIDEAQAIIDSCAPQSAARKDVRAAAALQANRNKGFSLLK